MNDSSSYLKLSRGAFKNNLVFIRSVLQAGVELCSVIKGNAYGHGMEDFIPMAEAEGVNKFAVYSYEEAKVFSTIASKESRLIIMGYIPEDKLHWVIEKGYEIFVSDLKRLKAIIQIGRKSDIKATIHIEIETGLNRTGIDEADVKTIVALYNENKNILDLEGLCTHLAGAESVGNYVRIKKQLKKFNSLKKYLLNEGLNFKKFHTACSAAVLSYPKAQMDMARVGILQYGLWPSMESYIQYITKQKEKIDPLKAMITWSSVILSCKWIKQGEYVGYGSSYLATNDMRIAIIPVGYSHGYSRVLSNQGRVLIRGKRVAVVGVVNMNLMAVNITGIPGAEVGDEVVLIGNQGENRISVSSFGELTTQLNYELLTRLPMDIPRIIVN